MRVRRPQEDEYKIRSNTSTAKKTIQEMTQKSKDIQPQAEAYIVKSHDIHIDADYADWIAGTMHRYLFCAGNLSFYEIQPI